LYAGLEHGLLEVETPAGDGVSAVVPAVAMIDGAGLQQTPVSFIKNHNIVARCRSRRRGGRMW